MFDIKAIYDAQSVEEASRLLLEHPKAKILAGGSDLFIQIREGRLAGCELVNIYGLDCLREIRLEDDGAIFIGALSSFRQIHEHPLIREHLLVLAEAVGMVGGPQIRNIGTLGGNTCNGVTSADSGATLLALDAEVELFASGASRRLPLEDFYLKAGVVDLRPGELQLGIRIAKNSYEGYRGHYVKYAMRRAMDIATLGCSVNLKLSPDAKSLDDLRIAYGVAGPVPMRARKAEALGRGERIDSALIRRIAAAATEDVNPRSSWRASRDFRLHLVRATCERAIKACLEASGASLYES